MPRPTMPGNTKVHIPSIGCDDCAALEYRVEQIERIIGSMSEVTYTLAGNENEVVLIGSDGSRSAASVIAVASCE